MYIMLGTRPDLAYTVSALSKFASRAGEIHITLAKRVLRYLRDTINVRITYTNEDIGPVDARGRTLIGYTDSDWRGNLAD
jgi:hypothetical protein